MNKTNKHKEEARPRGQAQPGCMPYHIFALLPSSSCLRASTPRGRQTLKVRRKEATGSCLSRTPRTNDLCIQLGNKITPQNTSFPITPNVYTVAYCLNSRAMCQPTTTLKNETRGRLLLCLPDSQALSLYLWMDAFPSLSRGDPRGQPSFCPHRNGNLYSS